MKSHRPERVATVVRAVVSDAIASKLSDPRIEPLSSVTRVEVSGDLEHAKVYISVMGTESAQRKTLAGLQSAAGVVQRMLARELSTRVCPRLSFHLDESIKRSIETVRLIDEAMAEHRGGQELPPEEENDEDSSGDDA